MAIIKCLSSKKSLKAGLDYVLNEGKTCGLVSGINCQPETAFFEMSCTKNLYNKNDGLQYKHIVQSFAPDEVSAEKAHQIGQEFIKNSRQFDGYEIILATHQDKGHIHNHFIINSVSFENGKKFHQSIKDLYQFREQSDQLCKENNLSIAEKGKTVDGKDRENVTAFNRGTYDIVSKADNGTAESWTHNIAEKVVTHAKTATSREDFIKSLDADGVRVIWKENRKNIVFEDKERQKTGQRYKVRNGTLGDRYNLDLSKESLENGFARNDGKQRTAAADRRIADYTITRHQQRTSGADKEIDNLVKRAAEREARERKQIKLATEREQKRLQEVAREKLQATKSSERIRTKNDDYSQGRSR